MDLRRISDWKAKLKRFGKRVGFASFAFGFVVSLLFQPYVNSALTHELHDQRAPGYEKHDLNFEMEKIHMNSYGEGETVPGYGGLEWDSNYTVYRISVENREPIPLTNFRMNVPFPGCVVHTETSEPYGRGDYKVRNAIDVMIRSTEKTSIRKLSCMKQISTPQLAPSEEITAEFVVTNSFEKCDMLMGYTPVLEEAHGNIRIEYFWQKRGVYLKERQKAGAAQDDDEYRSAPDSVYPASLEMRKDSLDTPYPVVIAGVGNSSFQSAVSRCH